MQSGLGQPTLPGGTGRPPWPGEATEGRRRQGREAETESVGSADEASPARLGGTEQGGGEA